MSLNPSPIQVLGKQLSPWLEGPYARLEEARLGGRLGHAWLLAGPAGVGKVNLALVIAHRLLAPAPGPPALLSAADAGPAMRARHAPVDHHPDLQWVFPEPEKRTISVDQVRAAGEALALKSLRGTGKVVILEPAEAMTPAAANALLKTLEEPTAETYLWLVSHRPERLPATIRSRCQTLPIAPPSATTAAAWLEPQLASPDGARLLRLAGGAPLRALAMAEIDLLSIDSKLSDELAAITEDRADALVVASRWLKLDAEVALGWLVTRLQLAIRARHESRPSNLVTDDWLDRLHNAWRVLTLRTLFGRLRAAEDLLDRLGAGINVELALGVLLLGFRRE